MVDEDLGAAVAAVGWRRRGGGVSDVIGQSDQHTLTEDTQATTRCLLSLASGEAALSTCVSGDGWGEVDGRGLHRRGRGQPARGGGEEKMKKSR